MLIIVFIFVKPKINDNLKFESQNFANHKENKRKTKISL